MYVDCILDCTATGQLGVGTTEVTCKPLRVELPEDFEAKSIFCGPDSSAILGEDGQLLVCGSNRCCSTIVLCELYKCHVTFRMVTWSVLFLYCVYDCTYSAEYALYTCLQRSQDLYCIVQ